MVTVIALETRDGSRREQHVRVADQDGVTFGLLEDAVACRGCADDVSGADVARTSPALDERARMVAAEIIDDDQLDVLEILIKTQRLQGEVDTVEVVVRRHADS